MRKTLGMNRHQKAARKPGEQKVSRAEIADLLDLSCSMEIDDRLVAAQYLCPCHIQARIPAVWEAVFRMMEDEERRVRLASWHTWEDGGLPSDEEAITRMEQILGRERDPKVRRFAEQIMRPVLAARAQHERTLQRLAAQPRQQLGKCDFCGAMAVPVTWALDTEIPSGDGVRAARICSECARLG